MPFFLRVTALIRARARSFVLKRGHQLNDGNSTLFFPLINDPNERSLLRVSLMLVTSGSVDADVSISAYRAADLNARARRDGHLSVTI